MRDIIAAIDCARKSTDQHVADEENQEPMKRDDFLNAVTSQGGPEMDSDNRLDVASARNEVCADLAMLIPADDEVRYGVQIGKRITKSRDGKLEVGNCTWLLVLLADLVELRVDSIAADGCTAAPETLKILSHKTPLAGAAPGPGVTRA